MSRTELTDLHVPSDDSASALRTFPVACLADAHAEHSVTMDVCRNVNAPRSCSTAMIQLKSVCQAPKSSYSRGPWACCCVRYAFAASSMLASCRSLCSTNCTKLASAGSKDDLCAIAATMVPSPVVCWGMTGAYPDHSRRRLDGQPAIYLRVSVEAAVMFKAPLQ